MLEQKKKKSWKTENILQANMVTAQHTSPAETMQPSKLVLAESLS